MIEAYDLSVGAKSTMANISTRGWVANGDDVMIAGFILGGDTGQSGDVLVRGLGPSLAKANVSGALPDPALELRDVNGAIVAANDNWQATQESEILALGAAPTNSLEAAIIQKINAGSYTVLLKGANHVGGIGLVEAYNLR